MVVGGAIICVLMLWKQRDCCVRVSGRSRLVSLCECEVTLKLTVKPKRGTFEAWRGVKEKRQEEK